MFLYNNRIKFLLVVFAALLFSCQDLEELNINPNGVTPEIAHPDLLLGTVISSTGKAVVNLGYGDIAGVMQHTQKDGWSGGHNSYEWTPSSVDWGGYYSILTNIMEMHKKVRGDGPGIPPGGGAGTEVICFWNDNGYLGGCPLYTCFERGTWRRGKHQARL